MHYIRKELQKLIKYAEGHGVKVTFSKENSDNSAEWVTDGSEIILYVWKTKSILKQWLDLTHELAHHKAWIANGKKTGLRITKAYIKANEDEELTENERHLIYQSEKDDSKYQLDIHYETQSKINIDRLKVEIDLSNWVYYKYYKTGDFPLMKHCTTKRKELMHEYGL